MAKSGNLTKQEMYYVKQNPENLTIEELAKELDRTPKTVAKHYIPLEQKQEEEKQEEEQKPEPAMFKLMGLHKRGKQNVATVMTKAASELADNMRSSQIGGSKKIKSAIHKPRG